MARAARRTTAIRDADAIDRSRLGRPHETGRVEHSAPAQVPDAAEALAAAVALRQAAAATRSAAHAAAKRKGRWSGAIALGALAALAIYLVSASALAGLGAPGADGFARGPFERRAVAAFSHWLRASARNDSELGEADERPVNPLNAPPADAWDGLYAGTMTTRADSHLVTFRVKVADGIGAGTESRLDCGTAPVALRISPSGKVSGMALVFGSTCLRTELAIRGRAVAGTLQLRLGSQFLELSRAD